MMKNAFLLLVLSVLCLLMWITSDRSSGQATQSGASLGVAISDSPAHVESATAHGDSRSSKWEACWDAQWNGVGEKPDGFGRE